MCNGSNGTPDLRDRFVVGAGNLYAVTATGGSRDAIVPSHTHTATVNDGGHSHGIRVGVAAKNTSTGSTGGDNWVDGQTDGATTGITVSIGTTGTSGTNANLPPYYALAYIMKG